MITISKRSSSSSSSSSPSSPVPAAGPVVHPPVVDFHLEVSPEMLVTDAGPSFRSTSFQASFLAHASTSTRAIGA